MFYVGGINKVAKLEIIHYFEQWKWDIWYNDFL